MVTCREETQNHINDTNTYMQTNLKLQVSQKTKKSCFEHLKGNLGLWWEYKFSKTFVLRLGSIFFASA